MKKKLPQTLSANDGRSSERQAQRGEQLVSVESQREFDLFTGEWADRVFVKLYVAARTSGLLSTISDRDWKTLCTLATYMDADGYCFPSQKELAAAMGCSRQMANERIRSLADFRFEGKSVLLIVKAERGKGGKWSSNGYRVQSVSSLRIYDDPDSQNSEAGERFDSSGDTTIGNVETVSRFLDTVGEIEPTVSSQTVTVQLDTNKKHSSEQDLSFEFRREKRDESSKQQRFGSVGKFAPTPIGDIVQQQYAQRLATRDAASEGNVWKAKVSQSSGDNDGEERERLLAFLQDFARELNDQAPLSSTITTVQRMFQRAGIAKEQWSDFLYRARAITQEHSAQIKHEAVKTGKSWPVKNKMPYFLAVLESLVGLRPQGATGSANAK